jgi:hypothetical protein
MVLCITPVKIKQESGKRTMMFDPKEFYELIENNPDADVAIKDNENKEIRTFNTKAIWEGLFSDRSDSRFRQQLLEAFRPE